jgi:putative ABC transport system permease protein
MRFADLFQLIVDNLNRRKGRVALTAVGVVIGTAAVVLLVSLAIGLQQSYTSQLYGINDLTRIDVYPDYSGGEMYGGGGMVIMGGGGGGGSSSQIQYLTNSYLQQIAGLPNVSMVIPQEYCNACGSLELGQLQGWSNIIGIETSDLADLGLTAADGVTTLARGTAIVGSTVAMNFYNPYLRPGQEASDPPDLMGQVLQMQLYRWDSEGNTITRTINIRVVGVLTQSSGEADWSIYVPMADATAWNEWYSGTRINRNRDGYSQAVVRATDVDHVLEVADAINTLGFQASTPQQYLQGIMNFFTILQLIFGGVGAIALLVAAIGIANTMTMAILERTREIGLMKALGATNKNVLTIFLGEAAGIGFIGGAGGMLIGWIASKLLNIVAVTYMTQQAASTGGVPTETVISTPLWLPLFALGFSTVIGLLSGLYPALRAVTLAPVTALKYE